MTDAQRVDVERVQKFVPAHSGGGMVAVITNAPEHTYVKWGEWADLLLQVAEQAAEIADWKRNSESALETIRMGRMLLAAMAEEVRAAGCVVNLDASPVVTNTRAEAAERAREESFIRVAKLAERWDRIADTHGARTFTGNDHRLFANELRAAILAVNGGSNG